MLKILCVSRFYKGVDFMRAVKKAGHEAYLLTSSKLNKEDWPWESLTDTYYMEEDKAGEWHMPTLITGLSYTMRKIKFDILVSLDDFDVENTAHLREYFRIDGMGETTSRYFRDKLAMRIKARDSDINVPAFTALFYDDEVNHFADTVPTPWMIKPRGQASATGIKKIHSKEELWEELHKLGDDRHKYLVERFAPGDVYHVDALTFNGKVIFSRTSQYMNTPFEVAHGGGIFRSHTVASKTADDKALLKMNEQIMESFGMQFSASHTEFIKGQDGQYYFLETSSRVGGANLAEMVEAATGINLWAEWANIEIAAHTNGKYKLPKVRTDHAGIIVSLSRFEKPDLSSFQDKEITWRMDKKHHFGLIISSKDHARIRELLHHYAERVQEEFHASLPAPDRPTN
jgi:biotin carboxylase